MSYIVVYRDRIKFGTTIYTRCLRKQTISQDSQDEREKIATFFKMKFV